MSMCENKCVRTEKNLDQQTVPVSGQRDYTMSGSRTFHFKLVLLGDSAVGKSCLVVRFVRDEVF